MKPNNSISTFVARGLWCSLGLAATMLSCQRANAIVICSSPDLPPGCGVYRTPQDVHTAFQNPDPQIIETIMMDTSHHRFLSPVITPLPGGDELEEFQSTLSGDVNVTLDGGGGATINLTLPYTLLGPVQIISTGRTGNPTGTFDTEMISMSLTGNVGGFNIHIRESPTLPSIGQTTVTDLGGGQYSIDSFFEIFTEVSVNGGAFVPADSSSIVTLVPEPSAAFLSLLGVVALFGRRNRA